MVWLDDLDVFLGVSHLIDNIVFNLSPVGGPIIVQKTVLIRSIKLRIGEILIQLFKEPVVSFFLIQPKRVKRRQISKMFPVLIQNDIFSVKIQILKHRRPVLDPCITALNVRRANHCLVVSDNELFVMSSPNILIHVLFDWLVFPLWVQDAECAAVGFELIDEGLFCPVLHVVYKEDDMDASFDGLDKFVQSGISGGGWVNSVSGDPKVLLTMVDKLPDLFEEVVAFNNKLSERKPEDMFEIPLGFNLKLMVKMNGRLVKLGIEWEEIEVLLLKLDWLELWGSHEECFILDN